MTDKALKAKGNGKNSQEEIIEDIPLPSIVHDVQKFVDHIESLRSAFPLVMESVNKSLVSKSKSFEKYFKSKSDEVNSKDGEVLYHIPADIVSDVLRRQKELTKASLSLNVLPQSFIVTLVSQYDFFIGQFTKQLFLHRPELLNKIEKQINFSDLLNFDSIDAAKSHILDKEIENLLRKSHIEQFSWFENKFSVKLHEGLDVWPRFVELTQRRNLFTHCDGVVSEQYLNICKKHKVVLDPAITLGARLSVDSKYFESSYQCILEIGVKLAQVLWRKVLPEKIEDADRSFMEITYEILLAQQYDLVILLNDFAQKFIKEYSRDEVRRIVLMNLALAYKWKGEAEKANELIANEDWSSCS